jgi:anti-sigma factor RsiW
MKCEIETPDHVGRLLDYSAGRLDAVAARRIEAHLRGCPACRNFVAAQSAVWETLDRWQAAPVSPDFDRRLYQRIRERVSWWEYLARPLRPLLARQGLPITAAAALVVVAGLLSQTPQRITAVEKTVPQVSQVEPPAPDQVDRALDDMEMLRELNRLVHAEAPDSRI